MKYEVVYQHAYSIVVEAENAADALCKADEYDSDEMEYIDIPPEVHPIED